jgi:hypothetical protein
VNRRTDWTAWTNLERGWSKLERDERDRRDMAIINANADRLNREAIDALDYQRLS